MHEMGLVRDLLKIVEEHAREAHAQKVLKVVLDVGAMSGVVPEALSFAFGVCAKTLPLTEEAVLEINRVAAMGSCAECRSSYDLLAESFRCPHCGSSKWAPISGHELSVKELEVA